MELRDRSRYWLQAVCLLAAFWTHGTARATPPVMLSYFEEGGHVERLMSFRGFAYFGATFSDQAGTHTALFRTDGTPEGTAPVWQADDLYSCVTLACGPTLLYFAAYHSGSDEGGIWCTDGTAAGCRHVWTFQADYRWGPEMGTVAALGDTLYFRAPWDATPYQDIALWRTDGTPETTNPLCSFQIAEWMTGNNGLVLPVPRLITPLGNKVLFAAYDAVLGDELWISDGTPEGTRVLRDLFPAAETPFTHFYSSLPQNLRAVGDVVFFDAGQYYTTGPMWPQNLGNSQVWRTDGTPEGTVPLSGPAYEAHSLVRLGDWVFAGNSFMQEPASLWRAPVSGTQAELVREFDSNMTMGPTNLVVINNRLYFSVWSRGYGAEIWASDGTFEGTGILADIRPGADDALTSYFIALPGQELLHTDGYHLYFIANDGVHGFEPWISDGTTAGTRMLANLRPNNLYAPASPMGVIGNWFLFLADDGSHGQQVWAVTPETGPEIEPGPCARSGLYEIGESIRLCIPGSGAWAIQWYHDGVPMPGQVFPTLQLFNLQPQDAGRYTALYDDGTKAPAEHEVYIAVGENVPAVRGPALAFLALLIAACGTLACASARRRPV